MAKPGNSLSSPSASPRSDPQKSSGITAAKIACFDISGTLVHHQTERPIPLMPLLLDSLIHTGWRVYFVTRWDEPTARLLLEPFFHATWHKPTWWKSSSQQEGQQVEMEIIPVYDKGSALQDLLCGDVREILFVDDRPDNLESVRALGDDRLELFGFLGSRKYAPEISTFCARNHLPLVLSAIDLAEMLHVTLPGMLFGRMRDRLLQMPNQDLLALVPGLNHPLSPLLGRTSVFDHRHVLSVLFERIPGAAGSRYDSIPPALLTPEEYATLWMNLAWLRCSKCIAKAIYRIAPAAADYIPDPAFPFPMGIALLKAGLDAVGRDAEIARPKHVPFEKDRLERLVEVYGETEWGPLLLGRT